MSTKVSKKDSPDPVRNKSFKVRDKSFFYIAIDRKFFKGIGTTRVEQSATVTSFSPFYKRTGPVVKKDIKTEVGKIHLLFSDFKEDAKQFKSRKQAEKAIRDIKKKFPTLALPVLRFYDVSTKHDRYIMQG